MLLKSDNNNNINFLYKIYSACRRAAASVKKKKNLMSGVSKVDAGIRRAAPRQCRPLLIIHNF